MLANLVPKLKARFTRSATECGADSSTAEQCDSVSTDLLINVLDEARLEYSTYNPLEAVVPMTMHVNNPRLILPFEPFTVTAVIIPTRRYFSSFGIPPSDFLASYYADPALSRVDQIYADYASPEATYIRNGREIRITSPYEEGAVAEVYVTRMREWSDIPAWAEPVLMKMALVKLIDHITVSSGTLLRIPTATGYFEFDGGRVMQNLRTKLEQEYMRTLQVRTPGLTHG